MATPTASPRSAGGRRSGTTSWSRTTRRTRSRFERRASGPERPAPRRRHEHLQPGLGRRHAEHRDEQPARQGRAGAPDGLLLAVPRQPVQHHARRGPVRRPRSSSSTSRRVASARATSSRASGAGMPFPVLKAATTTIMRDMTTDLIIGEMYRGTPIVYADYLGYDEIAHHAGPERPEAMDQLDRVDRMVRSLARAAREAPRTYHFILVSDHGQTQGAPFEDRYGIGLEDLVRELMTGEVTSLDATNDVEGWGHVNTFLTEAARTPGTTGRIVRRAMRGQTTDGVVAFGRERRPDARAPASRATPAPPRRSGSRRTGDPGPHRRGIGQPREHLLHGGPRADDPRGHRGGASAAAAGPRQPPGHRLHHGPQRGAWAARDRPQGRAPPRRTTRSTAKTRSAVFGPHTADNLRRLDGFEHIGDIFIISMYDPSTEEIAPFEHQVGCARRPRGRPDEGLRPLPGGARAAG